MMRAPQDISEARREMVRVAKYAGVKAGTIALALGVTKGTVDYYVRALGLVGYREPPPGPAGELWREVPGFAARVSNCGRIVGAKGRLLTPRPASSGGRPVVALCTKDRTVHRSLSQILLDVWGIEPATGRRAPWSAEDIATLRQCKTYAQALQRLPGRSQRSIEARIKRLGIRFERASRTTTADVARGSVPHLDPLYREARAIVPRGLQQADQDDLIAEIVMLRLEGLSTAAEALKEARRKLFGPRWRERSLDAPIPGTEGLTLMDRLDTEGVVR